jgi:hypothetical protein
MRSRSRAFEDCFAAGFAPLARVLEEQFGSIVVAAVDGEIDASNASREAALERAAASNDRTVV